MSYQPVRKSLIGILLIFLIASLIGCTPQSNRDGDKPGEQEGLSKEQITSALSSITDVQKITWSPDEKMVAYVQAGKPEKNGMDEAYLWQDGEEKAKLVRDVKPTTLGFFWAPDSKHFLINEKLGEGAAALYFQFDLKEGQSLADIKPENKVLRMILTYPEILDDSF